MIRVTYLLRRKPGLSTAEFYDYWRNEHGPLVASVAGKINALRYVQVHTLDDPANGAMAEARGGMETPYDGVAEVYFESRASLMAAIESAAGQEALAVLIEDEAKFLDLPNSPLWVGYEYPQVNPSPENSVARVRSNVVKLYFPLRCPADMDPVQAQFYWRTHHGPIIRRQAEASGIHRYLQVHRALDDELNEALTSARGTVVEPYLGHAELWFDHSGGGRSAEAKEANRVAIADESTFIDFRRSAMWLAKEHVFVDHR